MQRAIGLNEMAKINIQTAIKKLDKLADVLPPSSLDSTENNYNYSLLRIYRKIGDTKSAIETGQTMLRKTNENSTYQESLMNQLGLVYLSRGEYSQAEKYFRNAIQINSTDAAYLSNLGLILLEQGNIESATRYLNEEISIRTESLQIKRDKISLAYISNSHANLLELFLQTKDLEQAEYHYTEALRLLLEVDSTSRRPRFAEIYFKKAKLEHALGRYENSLSFIAKAMDVAAPQLAVLDTDEEITIVGSFKRALEILAFRAQVLTSQAKYEEALADVMLLNRLVTQSRRTYQSSLSKYYIIQEVMPVYELGIQLNQRLYGQTGDPKYLEQAYALNARNKAILLLESLQSDRAMTFAGLPLEVQEEEKTLRDALTEQERLLYSAYQRDQEIDSLQSVVFEHE
ncbi:MAG: tetratricopeptide repeat protein, partial [Bacteroidota bacterium]